jgi:DNA-directed RNA polymerase subunit alpha
VQNGRGYVPASEHSAGDHEIGIIPIDAVYSPVIRVRYQIDETRVGQKTNYDKLTLEVWTNGSVGPEMAVVEAAERLDGSLAAGGSAARLGFGPFPLRVTPADPAIPEKRERGTVAG